MICRRHDAWPNLVAITMLGVPQGNAIGSQLRNGAWKLVRNIVTSYFRIMFQTKQNFYEDNYGKAMLGTNYSIYLIIHQIRMH